MAARPEITQHDLCTRTEEIMDAVRNGQSFTVMRNGHRIGELVPLRRSEFAAMSLTAPDISLEAFRADQETTARQEPGIPQVRGPQPRPTSSRGTP
ncbi:type II toxin-antitoxin system Phd/YefM family antitoxin [Streptomyces sp. NPDC094448]|uniref:type II toxin-antitoxin system Phd/YefM family antitoxin n=1 Tax=Streptomyces sp. NPDC094448 TaxID=3366063 RepID=UPI00382776A9